MNDETVVVDAVSRFTNLARTLQRLQRPNRLTGSTDYMDSVGLHGHFARVSE